MLFHHSSWFLSFAYHVTPKVLIELLLTYLTENYSGYLRKPEVGGVEVFIQYLLNSFQNSMCDKEETLEKAGVQVKGGGEPASFSLWQLYPATWGLLEAKKNECWACQGMEN